MISSKKMETLMVFILTGGPLLSALLVFIGGSLYLLQHGSESMNSELLQASNYQLNIKEIFTVALSFSPIGIIELGLLILIITQLLRVGLLAVFYVSIRDYWFTLISSFILLVLIYSFIWRS